MNSTKRKRTKPRYDSHTIWFADELDVTEFGPRVASHLVLDDKWGRISSLLQGSRNDVAALHG